MINQNLIERIRTLLEVKESEIHKIREKYEKNKFLSDFIELTKQVYIYKGIVNTLISIDENLGKYYDKTANTMLLDNIELIEYVSKKFSVCVTY